MALGRRPRGRGPAGPRPRGRRRQGRGAGGSYPPGTSTGLGPCSGAQEGFGFSRVGNRIRGRQRSGGGMIGTDGPSRDPNGVGSFDARPRRRGMLLWEESDAPSGEWGGRGGHPLREPCWRGPGVGGEVGGGRVRRLLRASARARRLPGPPGTTAYTQAARSPPPGLSQRLTGGKIFCFCFFFVFRGHRPPGCVS